MSHQLQEELASRRLETAESKELSILSAPLSLFSALLNIPGNLLVIVVIAADPFKNLRTPFNYLVANLAFADLIVGKNL